MALTSSLNLAGGRGRMLPSLVVLLVGSSLGLAACGDGRDQAATIAPKAKAAPAGKAPSRILPQSEFKTTIVNREGLKPPPSPEQVAVAKRIEAAYAAVPKKDLMQVNMLMTCEARGRPSIIPFDQRASAISIASAKVRANPTAGIDCLKASRPSA